MLFQDTRKSDELKQNYYWKQVRVKIWLKTSVCRLSLSIAAWKKHMRTTFFVLFQKNDFRVFLSSVNLSILFCVVWLSASLNRNILVGSWTKIIFFSSLLKPPQKQQPTFHFWLFSHWAEHKLWTPHKIIHPSSSSSQRRRNEKIEITSPVHIPIILHTHTLQLLQVYHQFHNHHYHHHHHHCHYRH